jgi:hypothetical protein
MILFVILFVCVWAYRRFTVLAGVESDSAGDIDFLGHAFLATDAAQWH